jgi:uncharacterized protein with HEPN domain
MQRPESPDSAHMWDMRDALFAIEAYLAEVGESGFRQRGMAQDAILRQLTILGEAAARVSNAGRVAHRQIPWPRIVGLRNVVVHQYDRVSIDEVWEILDDACPGLAQQLDEILRANPIGDDRGRSDQTPHK